MTIDSSVSGSITSSQPIATQSSPADPGEVVRLRAEVESMHDTIRTLQHTITTQQAEIDRLLSFHQRRHQDDKIYNKAVKDGLSLRDADRLKTNTPTPIKPEAFFLPPSKPSAVLATPPTTHPRVLSKSTTAAVGKKEAVKQILVELINMWNSSPPASRVHKNMKLSNAPQSRNHPSASTDFQAMFKNDTRLKEDSINIITAAHKKSPESPPPSNPSIAGSILQTWINGLEPDGCLIEYMYELSTNTKFDSSTPAFSALHSMIWAILVSWNDKVKGFLKDSRKEFLNKSHITPQEPVVQDETPPAPPASQIPKRNFMWKTHSFSRHPVSVSGAGLAFVKSLTNGTTNPKDIENQLSALDQDLMDGTIDFSNATHLKLFKPCMMQLMTRLAHLGVTTTISDFIDSFFGGLLSLLATIHFSSRFDQLDSFLDSDHFEHGAHDGDFDAIFVALSKSTKKACLSIQILQFIVAQLVDDDSIMDRSASDWIQFVTKDLKLQSHEVDGSLKSNSLDDCVHLLGFVFLHFGFDSVQHRVRDVPALPVPAPHLQGLRLVIDAIIRVLFQRNQAADFWANWPFKPLGNNHARFFIENKVPSFLSVTTAREIAADKSAATKVPSAQPSARKRNAMKKTSTKRTSSTARNPQPDSIPFLTSSAKKRSTSKTEAEPKGKRTKKPVVLDEVLVDSE
ncbi:hypothetical protein HDU98_009906 [Podochytrium sp. JEL0797]|nr:hypothetical protein HDU98_009906 [Podochytrium sp. JEL0797]